jgi:tRNA-splicing ligase RtcB
MKQAQHYELVDHRSEGGGILKMWTTKVPVEDAARQQLRNMSTLPFVHRHIAVMPDVHLGRGATVGSVIPTKKAIVPASVGVDIGCGMCAMRTTLTANDLAENLKPLRLEIERAVPHGRNKGGGRNDKGSWHDLPNPIGRAWRRLEPEFKQICARYKHLERARSAIHLGTLGTGNHFIEVCLDESERVWVMLHSGSRGVGNAIGRTFIELARKDMARQKIHLPDKDLAYLREGSPQFEDYWFALSWAQRYARLNRDIMLDRVLDTLRRHKGLPGFKTDKVAINCHHNYVAIEKHYGEEVYVTRKGAIRAGEGDLGIIPGSMGTKSYIVRGKGNPESFSSCSHGAGRRMSRTAAKRTYTLDDHIAATRGVECRKDRDVIDETPMAYKAIDDVMASQRDLVDIEHTLRQVVCVKG